jgi:hypothetical protein
VIHAKNFAGTAIIALLGFALIAFCSSAIAEASSRTFSDVPPDHWSYEYVQDMINKGIIDGYSDGTFRPSDSLTREQFAKLLTVALDSELKAATEPTFMDVEADAWSYAYIETVKDYLEGYSLPFGKPFFDPNAIVTRQDVAVALVKGMGLSTDNIHAEQVIRERVWDYEAISDGLDVYVAVAMENQLIDGYPDGTFKPNNGLDRAAAATLLSRLLKSPVMPPIKDIGLTVNAPSKTERPYVNVTGTVSDDVKLYLYDEELPLTEGTFSKEVHLDNWDGSYELEFRAVKGNGRYQSVIKQLELTIPGPALTIKIPETTEKQTIVMSGKVKDVNDPDPLVMVNDDEVVVSAAGDWSREISLDEGINSIAVIAMNEYQKITEAVKKVTFTVKPPELTVDELATTVNVKSLKVSGKIKDGNDANPRLTLNGETITTSSSFSETIELKEGENLLSFEAKNSWGKTTTVNKKVNYVILPPMIVVENTEETVLDPTITLKVRATDMNDSSPRLYLDDQYLNTSSFSRSLTLKEGENLYNIKATNSLGKTSYVVKRFTYLILPPSLNVDTIPETTSSKTITIRATASDSKDRSPDITVNGSYAGESSISRSVTLSEGVNTITIKATNSAGKSTEVVKTITYTTPPPTITVISIPETTAGNTISIQVKATDANDSYPKIYMNGQYVDYSSYTKNQTLADGEKTYTFEFYATNSAGKKSEVITKQVIYAIPAPILTVVPLAERTSESQISISASAIDPSDSRPKLYLNGEFIKENSFTKTVTLVVGENIFTFKAVNSKGKQTEVVKRVYYELPAPATVPIPTVPDPILPQNTTPETPVSAPAL